MEASISQEGLKLELGAKTEMKGAREQRKRMMIIHGIAKVTSSVT